MTVYPRVCGGTLANLSPRIRKGGLSPRVRGNPAISKSTSPPTGSIPACAGEPAAGRFPVPRRRVYPRVCGGTVARMSKSAAGTGLSPRVRGNLLGLQPRPFQAGSIPACAGEPSLGSDGCTGVKVYPRVCGGTADLASQILPPQGLSPRVRGNPHLPRPAQRRARSIPACAGEPATSGSTHTLSSVYPRVCGGTRSQKNRTDASPGLSPRVRGNPRIHRGFQHAVRSIPACAGEPSTPVAA